MFLAVFFSKKARFSIFLDVHTEAWFSNQASRKRLQFNSLYSEKVQSALAKDTDKGKDFMETFVFLQTYYWHKGLN